MSDESALRDPFEDAGISLIGEKKTVIQVKKKELDFDDIVFIDPKKK